MSSKQKKILKSFIGFTVSTVFIVLVVRDLDYPFFLAAFADIDLVWIAFGFFSLFLAYALRIMRWRLLLLDNESKPKIKICAMTFLSSIALNNVLPLRAGDAFRIFATATWLEISTERVLAAMLFEKAADLIILVLIFVIVFFLIDPLAFQTNLLPFNISTLVVLSFALASFIVIMALLSKFFHFEKNKRMINSQRLLSKALKRLLSFTSSLAQYLKLRSLATLCTVSLFSWLAEVGVFVSSAFAIPDLEHKSFAFLAAPAGTLSTLLPSTPGYVGTFHYVVAKIAEFAGNENAVSIVFAVVAHLMLWLPTTIAGSLCLIFSTLKFNEFRVRTKGKIIEKTEQT